MALTLETECCSEALPGHPGVNLRSLRPDQSCEAYQTSPSRQSHARSDDVSSSTETGST